MLFMTINQSDKSTALTLVVLAAGMGTRYGGLKQLEPLGPHGETILDYSVFDAVRAGFGRVVFVIRREFAKTFMSQICSRYEGRVQVSCVFQDLHDLPGGFEVPSERIKPWGTVQAILAARHELYGPFAVVNADDFYGQDAFFRMADHCRRAAELPRTRELCAMVGYQMKNTLSPHGGVNRGICLEQDGDLQTIEEITDIALGADGGLWGVNFAGQHVGVAAQALTSMNFWGFAASVLDPMSACFMEFLRCHGDNLSAECYIPAVVDTLIRAQQLDCRVLSTTSQWFGVTYPQDRVVCVENIRQLIAAGAYPSRL